jgi:hypothetical protein
MGFALPPANLFPHGALKARRTIKPSDLLPFL